MGAVQSLILKPTLRSKSVSPGDERQRDWTIYGERSSHIFGTILSDPNTTGGNEFKISPNNQRCELVNDIQSFSLSVILILFIPSYAAFRRTQNEALLGASTTEKPLGCCYATNKYVWGVLLLSLLLPFSNLCTGGREKKNCTSSVLSALPPSLSVNRGLWWICSLLWSQRCGDKEVVFFSVQIAAHSKLIYTAQWQRRQLRCTEMENISAFHPYHHPLPSFAAFFTWSPIHIASLFDVPHLLPSASLRPGVRVFSPGRRGYWRAASLRRNWQASAVGSEVKTTRANYLRPCRLDTREINLRRPAARVLSILPYTRGRQPSCRLAHWDKLPVY